MFPFLLNGRPWHCLRRLARNINYCVKHSGANYTQIKAKHYFWFKNWGKGKI
jgi:hypothetical protein